MLMACACPLSSGTRLAVNKHLLCLIHPKEIGSRVLFEGKAALQKQNQSVMISAHLEDYLRTI